MGVGCYKDNNWKLFDKGKLLSIRYEPKNRDKKIIWNIKYLLRREKMDKKL